jgi:hypothetical protein
VREAFGDAALRGDDVTHVETQHHVARQEELETAAEVQAEIEVAADRRAIAADTETTRTDEHERRDAPQPELRDDMTADGPHRRALIVDGVRQHHPALGLEAEEADRVVAGPQTEVGRDALESLEALIGQRTIGIEELECARRQEDAAVDADLAHVALGRPALDPLLVLALVLGGARCGPRARRICAARTDRCAARGLGLGCCTRGQREQRDDGERSDGRKRRQRLHERTSARVSDSCRRESCRHDRLCLFLDAAKVLGAEKALRVNLVYVFRS